MDLNKYIIITVLIDNHLSIDRWEDMDRYPSILYAGNPQLFKLPKNCVPFLIIWSEEEIIYLLTGVEIDYLTIDLWFLFRSLATINLDLLC